MIMKHLSMKHAYIFCIVGVLFFCGCGGKLPFGGTVTYSDDGSPVTRGTVILRTPTFIAQGAIQEDGTYTIGTNNATDGLPPGTYQVTVVGTEDNIFLPANPNDVNSFTIAKLIPKVDPKFENPETSGLSATVDRKTRKFDIQVDRYTKPGR